MGRRQSRAVANFMRSGGGFSAKAMSLASPTVGIDHARNKALEAAHALFAPKTSGYTVDVIQSPAKATAEANEEDIEGGGLRIGMLKDFLSRNKGAEDVDDKPEGGRRRTSERSNYARTASWKLSRRNQYRG